jgi:hypothetical protein
VIHVVIPVSPPAPVGQGQGAAESARSDRQQADGYHHTDRTDGRTRAAVEPEAARFAQRLVHPGAADRAARHRLALARLPLQHSSMMVARHRRHTGESQAHRGRRSGGRRT